MLYTRTVSRVSLRLLEIVRPAALSQRSSPTHKVECAKISTSSMATIEQPQLTATIALMGDVMLGRLVDQLFPTHNDEPREQQIVRRLLPKSQWDAIASAGHKYVWGETYDILTTEANARIINLETSITTHGIKYPDKAFNFRMHPANVGILTCTHIDYCSLANNHTFDFQVEGYLETVRTLQQAGIHYSGVGNSIEDACRPAVYSPCPGLKLCSFSFADHPIEWRATGSQPGIAFLDPDNLNEEQLVRMDQHIRAVREAEGASAPNLVVTVSLHWGPNYRWRPYASFISLAHRLIDMGVDIIHGHSSHHPQGIEIYRGKPILYGCGDFIDDYAVDDDFRNDLSFLYLVKLARPTASAPWALASIELIPVHIRMMKASTSMSPLDRAWLVRTMQKLCAGFGTKLVEKEDGSQRLIIQHCQ